MSFDVAIIGTGPDPKDRDRDGFAMAYRHAAAYLARDDCELVACADIVPEHAAAFAEHVGLPSSAVFTDHRELCARSQPDVVSICVPPKAHAELVIDVAQAEGVTAIHCEKPMATRWDDCRTMVETAAAKNVQLTIDHQRRFATPVRRAKQLLDDDRIGEVRRLEWSELNLFDAGSHLFDLCDFFLDGETASWALAGVDTSEERRWFGTRNSARAVATWEYENGVQGLATTADGGATPVDAYLRIVGTDGTMEIQPDDGPPLRMRTDGAWEPVDTGGEHLYGGGSRWQGAITKVASLTGLREDLGPDRPNYGRAIDHVVDSLACGEEPDISGSTVLRGTELIFACWESARRCRRVDLPVQVKGNPLDEIVEADQRQPAPSR